MAGPSDRKSSIEKVEPSEIELVYSNVKLNAASVSRSSPFRRPRRERPKTTPRRSSRDSIRRSRWKPAKKKAEAAKKESRSRLSIQGQSTFPRLDRAPLPCPQ